MASPQPQVTGEQQVNKMYQMGPLLKRQRGLHHPYTRNLTFQTRWFILNQAALEYYKKEADYRKKKPQGTFPVRQIKIVEMVPQKTFGMNFCFQAGDDDEVLYLAAKSLDEMDKWMKEFKNGKTPQSAHILIKERELTAAKDSSNNMMAKYHTGVYQGKALRGRRAWSCCGGRKAKSEGCSQVESSERCQSENHGLEVENSIQRMRSNSEEFPPQPPLVNRPITKSISAKVLDSPRKDPPQPPHQSLPDLSLSPACRQLQLSNMIIPNSRIKLVETLGEASCGRFGVVYKAHLLNEGAPSQEMTVALKTPRDPEALHELWQEGLIMLKLLAHPHIMRLIDICKDGPTRGIIMPFMENGSLLSYVKKENDLVIPTDTKMEEAKVNQMSIKLMKMCLQIAKGMQHLAKIHLVHRDLAARNCMMDRQHVIKVADFGLTEEIYYGKNCYQRNQASALLPLKWMAPESSSKGDFSEKSDVWSFGITCWEVFSGGKMPYPAIPPYSLLSFLQEGHRLEKPLNAACSDEMFQVMKNCWKFSPKDRPTFSELITSIEAHVTGYINIIGIGNQAEASTQQKNEEKEFKAKAATEVFRQNFPQLLATVNAQKLVAVLFAKKVIGDEVLKEFYSSTCKNQGDQTLKLLHDVLKVIEADPECFGDVCTAVEQDCASNAETLRDAYKSCLEELTKDKANENDL